MEKLLNKIEKQWTKKLKKKNNNYNDDNLKKKYVNKELIESWIDAIKTSK